ncbi:hypothetical protein [Desulforamulus reducens]|uniref:hypothetical protein n=1 Tax=Desulforamulus reducens TaxID=59610 RepID=UPI00059E7803|nr:hypothetical protein [Desulforamulus reducens]
MEQCEEWLSSRLKNGKLVLCDDIRAEAKEQGFTKKQLKEARKKLKVKTFHQFDEHGGTSNWFWKIGTSS